MTKKELAKVALSGAHHLVLVLLVVACNSSSFFITLQVPYNIERLLLLFSDMDYALVDSLMQEFEQRNSLKIPQDLQLKVIERF